jgi:hypothetical protein
MPTLQSFIPNTTNAISSHLPIQQKVTRVYEQETPAKSTPRGQASASHIAQDSTTSSTSELLSLDQHLKKITSHIRHASFPLPYLTTLADSLNEKKEKLFLHTPFLPRGTSLFETPFDPTASNQDPQNLTIAPDHRILRVIESILEAANRTFDEADYDYYRSSLNVHTSLLSVLTHNNIWEQLIFDSDLLTRRLSKMASDFFWLGLTARGWEVAISEALGELTTSLLELDIHTDGLGNGKTEEALDILVKLERIVYVAQEHIRTWRAGVVALAEKEKTVRAQLEEFIAARRADDPYSVVVVGEDGKDYDLGAFYTPWMKERIACELECDGVNEGERFWMPGTRKRLWIVREMSFVVEGAAVRWEIVEQAVQRMREDSGVVSKRKGGKAEKERSWPWGWW